MESGRITLASLSQNIGVEMSKLNNSRLNKRVTDFPYGWQAKGDERDWIQIDLGSINQVESFIMLARYLFVFSTLVILQCMNAV